MAQIVAVFMISGVVAFFSNQPDLAIASGYGALIMLIVNTVLAQRIYTWSGLQSADRLQSRAFAIAGGRFLLIIALLVSGYYAGLWLPAVAGGMLVAQIAVYLAGFWLLIHSDETKKGTKGEAL
ncbi:MAG: hypothetical protein R8J85_02815 [Mariprofundales bacterium]